MCDFPETAVHRNIRDKCLDWLKVILGCPLTLPWICRRIFQLFKLEMFLALYVYGLMEYLTIVRNMNPYYAWGNSGNRTAKSFYRDWKNDPRLLNDTSQDAFQFPFTYYLYSVSEENYTLFDPSNVTELKGAEIFPDGIWYIPMHGYYMNSVQGPIKPETASDMKKMDPTCNILAPDYRVLTVPPHYEFFAFGYAQFVGEKMAELIYYLIQAGVAKVEKIHLIGYSAGASAAGNTGMYLQRKFGLKISRITGLCPSSMLFEFFSHQDDVLDRTDAEYVDIFHAAATAIGVWKPVGHVDYYINGGIPHQPFCGWDEILEYYLCSHSWARTIFVFSFNTTLVATRCESWESFIGDWPNWTSNCSFRIQDRCPDGVYWLDSCLNGIMA